MTRLYLVRYGTYGVCARKVLVQPSHSRITGNVLWPCSLQCLLLVPLALFFSSYAVINRYFPGRGARWFWLAKPVPPLQWAARLSLLVAMMLLLAPSPLTAALSAGLYALHMGLLTYARTRM